MIYRYEDRRSWPVSADGQRQFLRIRDRAFRLIDNAGAASLIRIIADETGDSWNMLACVDRLAELGELLEVPNPHHGRDRLFVRPTP